MTPTTIAMVVTVATFGLTTTGILWRMSAKWTNAIDRLEAIEVHTKALVDDKNRVHKEMNDQMREDRNATNERLRWLEQNLYNRTGRRR